MPRYKILIEYDGTDFAGWQKQPTAPSVQESLEQAIFKFSHEKTEVYGAGRTDAGVHARGQVAHFDLVKKLPIHTIINATNFHLRPAKICVLDCEQVPDAFHARYSAKKRVYKYVILTRPYPSPIDELRVWHVSEPLDVILMREAAKLFEGTHDFTCIKTSQCQATSHIKTIDYIKLSQREESIVIELCAPSFIHKMVRNIVGILRMIGNKRWKEKDIANLLKLSSPASQKFTAPPHGLYLEKIIF